MYSIGSLVNDSEVWLQGVDSDYRRAREWGRFSNIFLVPCEHRVKGIECLGCILSHYLIPKPRLPLFLTIRDIYPLRSRGEQHNSAVEVRGWDVYACKPVNTT